MFLNYKPSLVLAALTSRPTPNELINPNELNQIIRTLKRKFMLSKYLQVEQIPCSQYISAQKEFQILMNILTQQVQILGLLYRLVKHSRENVLIQETVSGTNLFSNVHLLT